MLTIIVAEESAMIRSSIKLLFSEENDFRITGEAKTYSELFRTLNLFNFDIIILDFNFHEKAGIEILKEIKISCPQLKVIIISRQYENQIVNKAFELGACGFVGKTDIADELVEAVKVVGAGKKYVSKHLQSKFDNFNFQSEDED
jgi:DNA-binding NarL/FixJ family response regulator